MISARMVELVDTRDLKSRGPGRVRAGSSPAPGTKINDLAPVSFRSLRPVCASIVPILFLCPTPPSNFGFLFLAVGHSWFWACCESQVSRFTQIILADDVVAVKNASRLWPDTIIDISQREHVSK